MVPVGPALWGLGLAAPGLLAPPTSVHRTTGMAMIFQGHSGGGYNRRGHTVSGVNVAAAGVVPYVSLPGRGIHFLLQVTAPARSNAPLRGLPEEPPPSPPPGYCQWYPSGAAL